MNNILRIKKWLIEYFAKEIDLINLMTFLRSTSPALIHYILNIKDPDNQAVEDIILMTNLKFNLTLNNRLYKNLTFTEMFDRIKVEMLRKKTIIMKVEDAPIEKKEM